MTRLSVPTRPPFPLSPLGRTPALPNNTGCGGTHLERRAVGVTPTCLIFLREALLRTARRRSSVKPLRPSHYRERGRQIGLASTCPLFGFSEKTLIPTPG